MDQLESCIRNRIFAADAKPGSTRTLVSRSSFVLAFSREDATTAKLVVTAAAKIETSDLLHKLQISLCGDCKCAQVSADHKHTKIEIMCPVENAPVSRLVNIRLEILSCWIQLNCMSTQKLQISPYLEISCAKGQVAILTRFATQWEAELAMEAINEVVATRPDITAIEAGNLQYKTFFSGREVAGFPAVACFKISRNSDYAYFMKIAAFADCLTSQVTLARIRARRSFFAEEFPNPAESEAINLVRAAYKELREYFPRYEILDMLDSASRVSLLWLQRHCSIASSFVQNELSRKWH